MIKLGVPHKDQVKVDSLASAINNSKLELESINADKVSKQKELNNVLSQLDFAVADLEQRQEATSKAIDNNLSKIDKLNAEIVSLESVKADLETKVLEVASSIEEEKSKVSTTIKGFEQTESNKLKSLNIDVTTLEAKKSELEDFIQVLSMDSLTNSVTVDNLKEEITKLEAELIIKRKEDLELEQNMSSVSSTHEILSNEVVLLQSDITNLNNIINSLNTEITKIEDIKSTLTNEVEALNTSKEEFNREKLAFQANKELILLREQFIIEKYNLAGVPYK
jgi:chromosome segregation ATPase